MPRPTFARIDAGALRHNFSKARELASPGRAMAVVKADGYGHGIERVAVALADTAERYAVACLEEADVLRKCRLQQPVVLLQGVHEAADISLCHTEGLEPVIHCREQLAWLEEATGRPALWLKVNTGMNRLGFSGSDLPRVIERLRALGYPLRGLMTHLSCADDQGSGRTADQTRLFEETCRPWPELWRSVSNSAAHWHKCRSLYDWARPGIMLYGTSPLIGSMGPDLGLQAVMTLESRVIAVRSLLPGATVGYGDTWTAERPTVMGMVCIGYGDGYPRHAGTGTPVWLRGRRSCLIGRVSMDMLAIDLTDIPGAAVGDRVELWGRNVSVDEVASHAGTISYELLAGVTRRVPRVSVMLAED